MQQPIHFRVVSSAKVSCSWKNSGLIAFAFPASRWGIHRESPSNGDLEFEATVTNKVATFVDDTPEWQYSLQLTFLNEAVVAYEQRVAGYFGRNVTFAGVFMRATAI